MPEIDGYEVLGPLGEGGMGIVWRAVQLSTRRQVALKLHRAGGFASPKALLRFEREVELAARLEHTHIARVYESGLRQGMYYYAMELIEGVHLDQYVAARGLSQRQVLPLMRTVCEAVQHAHQRGVIHRDLKPSNILVTADGQPHVVDFGLAKALLEDDAHLAVSMDGEVAGTPAYMSPEQAAAKLNQIDTRTDVYSLGVILYRLLTNEFPHDLSGTRLEVLRRIAEEEVRRPRQMTKAVDKELEALLLKALAHDPEGRYPTAHALAEDLRRYAAYEPIEARAMGSFGRIRRWCKRKPVVAGLVAAVVVALLAGTGISTYFGVVAQRRAAEAERQTRVANAQRLAAQSGNALDEYPQRSLRLAMEALETTLRQGEPRIPEAEQALRDALARVGGRPLQGHEGPIGCVAISSRWLVTGSLDKTARLWDLTAKDPAAAPIILRGHEEGIVCVAISPDSRWLVTGSWDKTARLWDLTANDPAAAPIVLRGHGGTICCVAISPDGRWLVTGSLDKTARLWDLTAKDLAAAPIVLRGHEGGIRCMAISPDGRWLVTGSLDKTARLWDLTAKDSSAVPAGTVLPVSGVKAVAFSPDNRWLVTGSDDKTARLWDLTAKDPAAAPTVLRGHEGYIGCVAISPDGRWLVTGSWDKTARLWDLTAKDPAAAPIILRGHEEGIVCVAISPDSRCLVTGSDDKTARLWDLTAKDLAAAPIVLRGHEGYIGCVAISPDGRWLVTGSEDKTARLWRLRLNELMDLARRTLGRESADKESDSAGLAHERSRFETERKSVTPAPARPPPEPVDALKAETKSWPVQTASLLSPSDARLFRVCGGQYGGEAVFMENMGCRVFGVYANKVVWSSFPLAARYWASVEFMFTKEGDLCLWMAGPGYGHSDRLGYCLTLSPRGCNLKREGKEVQRFRLPEGFDANKWHTAVASRDGNTLRLWIDDTLVMRYQDAAPLAGVLHSRFGFGSHYGRWEDGIWFRNLAIHAAPLSLSEDKTLAEVPLVPVSDILPSPNKECLLDCSGSALLSDAWSSRQPENVHPDNGRLILCGPNAGPALYRNEPVEGSFAYEVVMSYVAQVIPTPKDLGKSDAECYLKRGGIDNNFSMFIACGTPPRWNEKELAMAIPAGWRVALPKGASGLNELAWVAGESETCVAETPYYTPVGGKPYTVRLERKADTLRVFLDGKLLLQGKPQAEADTAKGPAYVGFMDEYHGVIVHSVRIYRIE